MSLNAMFEGLIYDEWDNPLRVKIIGEAAYYIIDDGGFHRHVAAEQIDTDIVTIFIEQLKGNQGMAVEQALRMLGQDDLMTKVAIESQLRNIKPEDIVGQILPQQAREMLSMMGFRIILNYRGEILRLDQPAAPDDEL